MRTSLNEIKLIEQHIEHQLSGEDDALFQAKLLLDKGLQENFHAQTKTYELVKAYGRNALRTELEAIHQHLFKEPMHQRFRIKIRSLFGLK